MHYVDSPDFEDKGGGRRWFKDVTPTTVLGKYLFNAVMEEIIGVIQAEGITLRASGGADEAADYASQLNQAIDNKVQTVETDLQLQIDDLEIDLDNTIANINNAVSFIGGTPDISDTSLLTNAILGIKNIPREREIIGYNINIRKQSDVYDHLWIHIDPGECADNSGTKKLLFGGTFGLNKRIDQNWSFSGDGGWPGIATANDTTYNVFLIYSSDGGKLSAGFDSSIEAINLLAYANSQPGESGWNYYRHLGKIHTKPGVFEIHYSEDITLQLSHFPRVVRSCFPLNTVGLSPNIEIMCECERIKNRLSISFPSHLGTATDDNLEYTFISANVTPSSILNSVYNMDSPCVFQDGASGTYTQQIGKLVLQASPLKFIGLVSGGGTGYLTPITFGTGGQKGMANTQRLDYYVWNNF